MWVGWTDRSHLIPSLTTPCICGALQRTMEICRCRRGHVPSGNGIWVQTSATAWGVLMTAFGQLSRNAYEVETPTRSTDTNVLTPDHVGSLNAMSVRVERPRQSRKLLPQLLYELASALIRPQHVLKVGVLLDAGIPGCSPLLRDVLIFPRLMDDFRDRRVRKCRLVRYQICLGVNSCG
jgi:hypothetical protein